MLDIYAGPLTRYYTKNWKTKNQVLAEQQGIIYRQLNPNDMSASSEPQATPEQIQEIVGLWSTTVLSSLSNHVGTQLSPWADKNDGPYYTNQLTWEAYNALVLWACFSECPELASKTPDLTNLQNNPAYERVNQDTFDSKYKTLTHGVELWLPGEYQLMFEGATPTGNKALMSTTNLMQAQLKALNESTWKAHGMDINAWLKNGTPGPQAPMETLAKYAFAVLTESVKFCQQQNLPMKLDY